MAVPIDGRGEETPNFMEIWTKRAVLRLKIGQPFGRYA